MIALLKKEFSLARHITSVLFIFLAAMVFIPNYPYEVMFFFSGLSAFFICLTGRENRDLQFTLVMPVKKKDVAAARVLFCVLLQLAQVVLCVPFIALKSAFIPVSNLAGIEANAAFLGEGLIILSAFNLTFFPAYFKNPNRVEKPFLLAAALVFLLIGANVACCQTIPAFKNILDTPDPQFFGIKCAVFAAGAVVYAVAAFFTCRLSQKNFESIDL